MNNNLDCPVDFVPINENRARMVAFLVLLLVVSCYVTVNWLIAAFLLVDFALRSFYLNQFSVLAILAGLLIKLFKIKNKPVDRAPKRFAAFVGLSFMVMILLALLTGFINTAKVLLIVIMIFAVLESLAGFCAGCYVYTYLKRFGLIK
ncbi:DUF4395 domain-containing protein [Mucilaginibacter sp. S1162]|uniref:DUF4395 domain-containing protein n=1 Tax=Mucilaginibacter humi TaxID=2732510 RepID=A0ABX1W0X6_9SPHI|nr:DUF4395 domain-containing protein [Mucilaginibacter humi]NNU33882.1 DUF4395 domain-containing protein [Mucilaginibacter humi]